MTSPNVFLKMTSGHQSAFLAEPEAVTQIAAQVVRGRAFKEDSIKVSGPLEAHVVAARYVARIDLHGELGTVPLRPDAHPDEPTVMSYEITEAEYNAGTRQITSTYSDRTEMLADGRHIQVYGVLVLHGGWKVFLRFDLEVPTVQEQRRFLHRLLALPLLAFNNITGGTGMINPAHIVHATFHPGATPPTDAWHATEVIV